MEKIQWKVEGMDCANCALTIHKFLEKKGGQNIRVNAGNGDVSFDISQPSLVDKMAKGISDLGYEVVKDEVNVNPASRKKRYLSTHLGRFWFCLPFTFLLMVDMLPGIHIHWLMLPVVQLALSLPVYLMGMSFFGKSAIKSIRNGLPNMNVLIAVGATAAFVYSLYGTVIGQAENYMFYETAAAVITLIFLGNFLEDATMESTQRSLHALVKSQKVMANMIAFDDEHQEQIFPVENTALKVGDLLLIKTGEQVPIDCKILWGDASVNEAVITGESIPIAKTKKDTLIGGSILVTGTVKVQVTATGSETVLAGIINLVRQAQGEKSPVQQLADRISAVFVPVVLIIALTTLGINWAVLHEFTPSLMRSIAVLVIACPCAMGLATPAAIAVGLGRAARNGILFRSAKSLELFKNIRQVVFDKTGTLTTGKFKITNWQLTPAAFADEKAATGEFKKIAYSLEKYSNHPLARSISTEWKSRDEIKWNKIEESRGLGMKAVDLAGNIYQAGSFRIAAHLTTDDSHNVYFLRNDQLLGWLDIRDELRPEAGAVIRYLRARNIHTVLLSGDRAEKAKEIGLELQMDEVVAEQSPEQKLEFIAARSAAMPTVMVGDGINDAPALAKATVGISMSDASQLAMQTAQVVLMNHGLKHLPMALGLGRHTYITIKQNLFWAFAYNIVAIPIAAFGLLTPAFGALVMALSDVFLAINSGRLFFKKVE